MECAVSTEGGTKGREGQADEKESLGAIAIQIGMSPQGQIFAVPLEDAEIVTIGGRKAFRGIANDGKVLVRFVDTTLGYQEVSAVTIVKNMPRQ